MSTFEVFGGSIPAILYPTSGALSHSTACLKSDTVVFHPVHTSGRPAAWSSLPFTCMYMCVHKQAGVQCECPRCGDDHGYHGIGWSELSITECMVVCVGGGRVRVS